MTVVARSLAILALLTTLAACGFSGGGTCIGNFCPKPRTNLDCGGGATATVDANGDAVCPEPSTKR